MACGIIGHTEAEASNAAWVSRPPAPTSSGVLISKLHRSPHSRTPVCTHHVLWAYANMSSCSFAEFCFEETEHEQRVILSTSTEIQAQGADDDFFARRAWHSGVGVSTSLRSTAHRPWSQKLPPCLQGIEGGVKVPLPGTRCNDAKACQGRPDCDSQFHLGRLSRPGKMKIVGLNAWSHFALVLPKPSAPKTAMRDMAQRPTIMKAIVRIFGMCCSPNSFKSKLPQKTRKMEALVCREQRTCRVPASFSHAACFHLRAVISLQHSCCHCMYRGLEP